MKNRFNIFLRSILYTLATFGLTQFIGIPVVGNVFGSFLRMISGGLQLASDGVESLSEYVQYDSLEAAQDAIAAQTAAGARVEGMYPRGDGAMAIKWDTSDFAGDDIAVECIESNMQWDIA